MKSRYSSQYKDVPLEDNMIIFENKTLIIWNISVEWFNMSLLVYFKYLRDWSYCTAGGQTLEILKTFIKGTGTRIRWRLLGHCLSHMRYMPRWDWGRTRRPTQRHWYCIPRPKRTCLESQILSSSPHGILLLPWLGEARSNEGANRGLRSKGHQWLYFSRLGRSQDMRTDHKNVLLASSLDRRLDSGRNNKPGLTSSVHFFMSTMTCFLNADLILSTYIRDQYL